MYFLQLLGTVMVASAAVMWAALFTYAYHEVHTLLLNRCRDLLYFIHYIDNISRIWTGNLLIDWKAFFG